MLAKQKAASVRNSERKSHGAKIQTLALSTSKRRLNQKAPFISKLNYLVERMIF